MSAIPPYGLEDVTKGRNMGSRNAEPVRGTRTPPLDSAYAGMTGGGAPGL